MVSHVPQMATLKTTHTHTQTDTDSLSAHMRPVDCLTAVHLLVLLGKELTAPNPPPPAPRPGAQVDLGARGMRVPFGLGTLCGVLSRMPTNVLSHEQLTPNSPPFKFQFDEYWVCHTKDTFFGH